MFMNVLVFKAISGVAHVNGTLEEILIILSLGVGASRVYVGVYYPMDVLGSYQQTEQKDVRLVYQPLINYSPSGKAKSQGVVPLYFNDIQGNFAEKLS